MRTLDGLVARLDEFQARTGRTDWSMGIDIARDCRAITRIRTGKATLEMVARLDDLMASE